jgi:hypothetical protein
MPEIAVTQSAANADKDSLVYELARIVNQISAAIVELDADATGGGVVSILPDTITFRETGDPS